MPVIPIYFGKPKNIASHQIVEEEYAAVDFSAELVEAAKVEADSEFQQESAPMPNYHYLALLGNSLKDWSKGSDIYCYSSAHSSRGMAGVALFMALAELEEITKKGGILSFSKNEKDYIARELFDRQFLKLETSGVAKDREEVVAAILEKLENPSQSTGVHEIKNIESYEAFTKEKLSYRQRIYIAKKKRYFDVAVPSDFDAGYLVLGRQPKNTTDMDRRLERCKKRLEVNSSSQSLLSTSSSESSLSVDVTPTTLLKESILFPYQAKRRLSFLPSDEGMSEPVMPEIFKSLATYTVVMAVASAIVSFIAKLLAMMSGKEPVVEQKPQSVFTEITSTLMGGHMRARSSLNSLQLFSDS